MIAEHRLYYLTDVADHVIYLEDGRIAADWTMEQFRILPAQRRREMGLRAIDLAGERPDCAASSAVMVCGKELLVFDEPTGGLDYDGMVRLAALIRRLSAMSKVIFIVTHDYEFVCRTCTRALHLDDGGIREDLAVLPQNLPAIHAVFDAK